MTIKDFVKYADKMDNKLWAQAYGVHNRLHENDN